MAIRLVDVIGFTACSGFSVTSLSSYRQFSQSQFFTLGTDIRNLPNGTIFQTTSMKVTKTSNAVNVYNSNNVLLTSCTGISFSSTTFFGLAFAIDDATHKGSCVNCYNASGYYFATTQEWITTDTTDLYNAIIGSEVPTYTWQSVSSISGKNGILTLSTLNDVNDGEPVETSDTSKFNLTDDSNVSALVAAYFSQ